MHRRELDFPRIGMIQQKLIDRPIKNIPIEVKKEIDDLYISKKIKKGDTVAITAGSRGIRNIDKIIRQVVLYLKSLGAKPFIFPAMGSHGGATKGGQIEAPIKATMEVKEIGKTKNGVSVFVDSFALQADHIVIINRIKPHTKWKGCLESGLCKMMAIGIGKHKGAQYYHRLALKYGFPELLEQVANIVLKKLPILFALAIIEDGFEQTSIIKALSPKELIEKEKMLLDKAKEYLPKLPFNEIDILIIDRIGKEISGSGMDYNVIGRNRDIMNKWYSSQKIKRIFVRDLTKYSKGNGLGIGMADFTTKRLVDKLNLKSMYINALTASGPENSSIPMYFFSDKEALEACLNTIGPISSKDVRLIWIRDTLSMKEVIVSESLFMKSIKLKDILIIKGLKEFKFNNNNNLISPFNNPLDRGC